MEPLVIIVVILMVILCIIIIKNSRRDSFSRGGGRGGWGGRGWGGRGWGRGWWNGSNLIDVDFPYSPYYSLKRDFNENYNIDRCTEILSKTPQCQKEESSYLCALRRCSHPLH